MELGLTGKRALVTGASRGIGYAIAAGLVAEGARVALVARTANDVEAAANRLREAGTEAIALTGDLTVSAEV
ncbi:MAG: SDR family oxidoreductase, partial [Chloroflexota bacterium]|nr:SDR family oxidoreductase [Chloroflexota bacterium]